MTERAPTNALLVGSGQFRYSVKDTWPAFPAAAADGEAVAVACDSRDRVFVFLRGPRPVQVFDRDGTRLYSWGEGVFVRPHGIFIGPDDTVSIRPVKVGMTQGNDLAVDDGLQPGDRVVVDGAEKLTEGMKVTVNPIASTRSPRGTQ